MTMVFQSGTGRKHRVWQKKRKTQDFVLVQKFAALLSTRRYFRLQQWSGKRTAHNTRMDRLSCWKRKVVLGQTKIRRRRMEHSKCAVRWTIVLEWRPVSQWGLNAVQLILKWWSEVGCETCHMFWLKTKDAFVLKENASWDFSFAFLDVLEFTLINNIFNQFWPLTRFLTNQQASWPHKPEKNAFFSDSCRQAAELWFFHETAISKF